MANPKPTRSPHIRSIRPSYARTIASVVCCALIAGFAAHFSTSRAAERNPASVRTALPGGNARQKQAGSNELALQPKTDAPKSDEGRKRSSGLVGISVEYDDIRCQTVQARYSIRIPTGAVMVDVDGDRLPLTNAETLAAAPAPCLFLPRGVHQVRFRQNESAISVEIEKDYVDEYAKMRRFFDVDHKVRDRELLQRAARAMDVHGTPFLLNFLGASYAEQGHWAAAERTFQRALAINPCFSPAHLNLAECFRRRGDRDRAAAEIDVADVFNVGNVFGMAAAISQMRIDLQRPPDRPSAMKFTLSNYAASEALSDQDRRVVGVLRALAKYAVEDEERCKILNNIGAHFADVGKPEVALTHFRSALAVARGAGENRFPLARQILSHMHATCQRASFDEAADYELMTTLVSP